MAHLAHVHRFKDTSPPKHECQTSYPAIYTHKHVSIAYYLVHVHRLEDGQSGEIRELSLVAVHLTQQEPKLKGGVCVAVWTGHLPQQDTPGSIGTP